MNTRPAYAPRQRVAGSALLVTLLTGLIIGIVLISYLQLVRHQSDTVARAQAWNAAMAAAEAGVEEALAQLRPDGVFNVKLINKGANGWSLAGGSYRMPGFPTARPLAGNASYVVRFTDTVTPVIYATGYVRIPALSATVSRAVEVKTIAGSLFPAGMTAISNITMNGNNVRTDSYNSTNSAYSTGGKYDPKKARSNGDVASLYGLISVGNANIRGHLYTGPTASQSVGANGLVGDMNWKGPGVQTNYATADFNMEFPDAPQPGSWFAPPNTMANVKVDGTTYQYAFTAGGSYKIPGLSSSLYIGSGATVELHITSNVKVSGQDKIYIAPGGKLTIYMDAASCDIGGGGLINDNNSAANFAYYGQPSNTDVKFGGNAAFTGTIYAPNASLTMTGGGGQSQVDFSGATVTRSVTMNGGLNFHYDEALTTLGPTIIKGASWREL